MNQLIPHSIHFTQIDYTLSLLSSIPSFSYFHIRTPSLRRRLESLPNARSRRQFPPLDAWRQTLACGERRERDE